MKKNNMTNNVSIKNAMRNIRKGILVEELVLPGYSANQTNDQKMSIYTTAVRLELSKRTTQFTQKKTVRYVRITF